MNGDVIDPIYRIGPSMPEGPLIKDQDLYHAQEQFEKYIEQENNARDLLVNAQLGFELAVSDYIKQHKSEGTITVLKELARGECKELYEKYVRAEVDLKKVQAGIRLWENRIMTFKVLMRNRMGGY